MAENPALTLQYAIALTSLRSATSYKAWRKFKPGQLYERLPETMKDNLKNLKSEDFKILRKDIVEAFIQDGEYEWSRREADEGTWWKHLNLSCYSPSFAKQTWDNYKWQRDKIEREKPTKIIEVCGFLD